MAKISTYILCFFLLFLGGCNRLPESSVVEKPVLIAPVRKVIPDPVIVTDPQPVLDTLEAIALEPDYLKKSISDVYLSQIGVREKSGNNDGPEVEKYLHSVNTKKGAPWCAAFVHWCLIEAGVQNNISAWSPTAQNKKHLVYSARRQLEEPASGDVFCLYYPKLKRIGHTGFYHQRINESVFESVEGNTNNAGSREGDGVYRKYRSFNATYSISRWE